MLFIVTRFSLRPWIALLCACAAVSLCSAGQTNAPVRSLGNGLFQVGSVRLNKNDRSITFPGAANIVAELALEYAVVHKFGKTHESLFRTDATAQDIHVAMLLLGVHAAVTNAFPDDLAVAPPGDKVTIEASWKKGGRSVRYSLEDLILNRETGRPLSRGPWIYNGSNFSEGWFVAQRDGSIVSIHIDPDALINNPRPGRENDDLHVPNTKVLPAPGAPVEITIRLARTSSASAEAH